MKVPLGWLREYVELPRDADAVAEMLAAIGFPVDEIERRPVITGVVAGHIVSLDKHPNADRLQVGKIDAGTGTPLTIATAATNVAQGQSIPVALIGAQLPQLRIERRKMRGIESEGMMISAEELALPPEWFEDGIMQLEDGIKPGTDVVELFGLAEPVLDVEITSNRVDAMSLIGLARELAAYQGVQLRESPAASFDTASNAANLRITLDSPDCLQFLMARFTGVRVTQSPASMRVRLALAGQRPINSIVDISNFVMLETGQPLHFYDAAKIPNGHLIARDAREGEVLTTLDGRERELDSKDLVIASEAQAEGLAGLMGGAHSEVSEHTRELLVESATFDGPRVRRMSSRHGLRSEAGTRNEKNVPPVLAWLGMQRACKLLAYSGATLQETASVGSERARERNAPAPIDFDLRDVRRLLGYALTAPEVTGYLDRLGFAVEAADGQRLEVTAPPWRGDVRLSADVVEEIARMAGYDRIESVIPAVPSHAISSSDYELESRCAQTLRALGYHEIATLALHGESVFARMRDAGIEASRTPVEVLNPLSEEQRYLRFALGPVHLEYYARLDRPARTFEIAHTFWNEEGSPHESAMAAFSFTAEPDDAPAWHDASFLALKGDAEALLHALTGRRDIEAAHDARNGAHPGKTAALLIDGREVAMICQVDPRLQRAFNVERPVYGCWIYLDRIPDYAVSRYRPPSKYPSTYRDLALVCDVDLPASRVQQTLSHALGALCTNVRAFDEYRGPQVGEGKKSLAVRATLQRFDATITDDDADAAVARALQALARELGVTLRG